MNTKELQSTMLQLTSVCHNPHDIRMNSVRVKYYVERFGLQEKDQEVTNVAFLVNLAE